jgi:hypothetical protein
MTSGSMFGLVIVRFSTTQPRYSVDFATGGPRFGASRDVRTTRPL